MYPLFPKKHKKEIIRKPWITKGIIKSIHTKNKLFKRYIRDPNNNSLSNKFKKYRNRLNSVIKLSRKQYYFQKLHTVSGNIKETWGVLNNLLGKKRSSVFPTNLKYENNESCDQKEIVNIWFQASSNFM